MVKDSGFKLKSENMQTQGVSYLIEISKKEHEIAVLNSHINDLQIQIRKNETARALTRQLFNKFDDKIMRFFNEKGKKKQPVKRNHPQILLKGDESYSDLLNIAREYDVKEFFAYKRTASNSPLRPHYRVAAKIYRTSRDGTLHIGSKLYRKTRKTEL